MCRGHFASRVARNLDSSSAVRYLNRGGPSAARVGSDDGKSGTARIARWQIVPRRARAQDPQDAVHDGPRIGPRPAAPVRATARTERRFEHGPLDVGEVHAVEYDGDPTDVSR
jgi:hypothetical protein